MEQHTLQPEWWTPREVADRWRLSVSTIHRMHRERDNFGTTISGSLRIHRDDIAAIERRDLQRAASKTIRRQRTYAAVGGKDRFPD